jgi:PAS domain S-box-containing protein
VLAAVLDRLPDGIGLLDGDWTLCYVNPAGAELLGSSPGQLLGRVLWDVAPRARDTGFAAFLRHARRAGTPMTWRGVHARTGRELTATAELVGELLQVRVPGPADVGPGAGPSGSRTGGEDDPGALRLLAEVFEALSGTLDTAETADRLARFVVPRLADWATVTVLGMDGAPARSARAHRSAERLADVDTYLAGRVTAPRDRSSLTAALLSGEPVQLTSIDPEFGVPSLPNRAVREAWRRLDPTSCLFVPLQSRGEPFGVLSLVTCGSRAPHTGAEIATAVEIARRGALALDNARLYGRQLELAETLQHSLLTPPPQPPGLEIAVRYRPATTHALVGGDWYDAFGQEDGATLLVIGDVAGHNVEATAAMAQLRSAVRTLAYDRPGSPARTLERVDRLLSGLGVGTLATALIARLDLPAADGTRTLRWSSAGHVPPLLVRADGSVRVLEAPPERLLGTEQPLPHTDHEVGVRPGDTVVLVTDGLVEAGRTGIDEGVDRLTGALTELGALGPDALCDRLLSRIVPDRADDDVAVLAVRCTG